MKLQKISNRNRWSLQKQTILYQSGASRLHEPQYAPSVISGKACNLRRRVSPPDRDPRFAERVVAETRALLSAVPTYKEER